MAFVFPAASPPAVTLVDSDDLFAVRRIYCVGRNYAAHAREMGHDPSREPPFFFMKPAQCVQNLRYGTTIKHPYPPQTQNYHFEVELVAALKAGGRDLTVEAAEQAIFAYAIGLDMTRRDLQEEAKGLKRPWDLGKAADHSAPIGPLHRVAQTGLMNKGSISLSLNGVLKQKGNLADMIWSVPEQISFLSRYFELEAGDVIFTGTPEGVGAVERRDVIEASIEGLGAIRLEVV